MRPGRGALHRGRSPTWGPTATPGRERDRGEDVRAWRRPLLQGLAGLLLAAALAACSLNPAPPAPAGDPALSPQTDGPSFGPPSLWANAFGFSAGGWRVENHPRFLADVDGDGRADVVGFANAGVYVALSTGTSFSAPSYWVRAFGYAAGGWRVGRHPRLLADMNGDGRADVVGFANDGVYVSLSTGASFGPPQRWSGGFGYGGGWRVENHPRFLADVDGDGRADVVGFAGGGVVVSLSSGSGLSLPRQWLNAFGYSAGGWRVDQHPRLLADVDGDERLDVVGFGSAGVDVALSTGSGFSAPRRVVDAFGARNGWRVDQHPRLLADVDGDGLPDLVGFGDAGVYVSTAQSGDSPPEPPRPPRSLDEIVHLQMRPSGVLFTARGQRKDLTVHAYDADGRELDLAGIGLDWLASDAGVLGLTVDRGDPRRATVEARAELGSAVVVARLRGKPSLMTPPTFVTIARVGDGVTLVPDAQVVFPPPDAPEGVDLTVFRPRDFVFSRSPTLIGGFAESEVAALIEATGDLGLRFPLVLRGRAPAVGSLLLASESVPLAGRVVRAVQRGDFALVQVESAPLPELFRDLEIDVSAERLIEDGLLAPFDTSSWEGDRVDLVAAREGGAALAERGDGVDVSAFKVGGWECEGVPFPAYTIKRSNPYFGPIWDFALSFRDYEVERVFAKVGLLAKLEIKPEITIAPGGVDYKLTCKPPADKRLTRLIPIGGPVSAVVAPYLQVYPAVRLTGQMASGLLSVRAGAGIDFEYSLFTGFEYQNGTLRPICDSYETCSTSKWDAEAVLNVSEDLDGLHLRFGAALLGTVDVGLQVGGVVINKVSSWFGELPLIGRKIKEVEKAAQLPVLRGEYGPQLLARWSNTARTVFVENSEGAANIVLAGDIKLTLKDLVKPISKAIRVPLPIPNLPLFTLPEVHLVPPFDALEEQQIFVNGQRVVSDLTSSPLTVHAGDTLDIRTTVRKEAKFLSLIRALLSALLPDLHQDEPHRGEIWLSTRRIGVGIGEASGGVVSAQKVGELTATGTFELRGTLTITEPLCKVARGSLGRTAKVQLVADNRMFKVIPTPNYAGDFEIACALVVDDPLPPPEDEPNSPPDAVDDLAVVSDDFQPVTIDVLANDSDTDGDALVIAGHGRPSGGKLSLVDAAFVYTPTSAFAGEDSFDYTVVDGRGGSDTATVRIVGR